MVAGSGAAGMTAALTAAHHGLSVLVHREGRVVRRLHRPLRRRDLGCRATRCCAPPGWRTRRSRPAPTWRTWPTGCPAGAAARRCSTHGPDDARPGPGATRRVRLRVGARLRRLLPRGARRAGRGAQHRARAARRPACSAPNWPTWPALPAAPAAWPSPRPTTGGSASGPGIRGRVLAAARVAGRAAPRQAAAGSGCSAWARRWPRGCGPGWRHSGVPVWLDTPLAGLDVEDGRVTGVRADPGRGAAADPGPARGAARHRRLRAQRADAPPLPARADRDRVDDRRGREHRRRDPRRAWTSARPST